MFLKTLLISSLALWVSGCGFHLRGETDLAEKLPSLSINEPTQIAPFHRFLKHTLQLSQVDLVSPNAHTPHLAITQERFDEQSLGISSNGQLHRARLILTVNYQLNAPHFERPIKNQIVLSREFDINRATILGSDNERDIHKEELLQDAAIQLIRQLSSYSSSPP